MSNSYNTFMGEFMSSLKFYNYRWHKGKDISIDWIMKNVQGDKFLDIGGTVELVKALNKKGISASIYDAFPLSGLQDNECKTIYCGEFSEILDIVGTEKFHTVSCRHSLEHCLNPMFVLWQMNQILCDHGRLIVIIPPFHRKWVWFYTHFNCLPEENWEMLFWRAGFRIENKEHGFWDAAQKDPLFIETRYVLTSETKSLRIDGFGLNKSPKFHHLNKKK